MTDTIDNSQDIIDSRDVIARVEELRDMESRDQDETDELAALEALAKDAESYSDDWEYGATLIRDSYFKEYAMELADDIGAIDKDASWPCNCIDWDQAARELRMDYTAVEFDGVTYWVR
jgi:antirestriction protein